MRRPMTKRGCRTIACTTVLALVALALGAATSAFGQGTGSTCGGGVSATFNTPEDVTTGGYLVGDTVSITATVSRSGASTTTETATFSTFDLDLACSSFNAFPCTTLDTTGPDSWEGVTGTTCVNASSAAITWSSSDANGSTTQPVTLTATNGPVVLTGNGSCNITYSVMLLKVANDSGTDQIAHSAGTPTNGLSCSSGGTAQADGSYAIPVNSCGITLDKQISCDYAYFNSISNAAGATWSDVGPYDGNPSSTNHCQGFEGSNTSDPTDVIAIRYLISNTGTEQETGCSITQDVSGSSVAVDTPGTFANPIAAGGQEYSSVTTEDATGGTNSLTCDTSHTANEPNTATAQCSCANTTPSVKPTAMDTATFSCVSCSVNLDKQVSCNGGTTIYDQECCTSTGPNVPFGCSTDVTTCDSGNGSTQSANCIGFDASCSDGSVPTCSFSGTPPVENCSCTTGTLIAASNVEVNYFIDNTGADPVTCSGTVNTQVLGLGDTDVTITGESNPVEGTLNSTFAAGATQEISAVDPCNPNFSATSGAEPDTATLNCSCNNLNGNFAVKIVSSMDTATFSCQQPKLALTKTCGAVASGNAAPVTVTATNTGDSELFNCAVTDNYSTAGLCPQTGTTGVTLTADAANPGVMPTSFNLTASAQDIFDGSTGALTSNACNDASVTCNVGSVTGPAITATASASCPVGSGCEGATPGFFKNHPETVDEVILGDVGTITSCGLVLNNAEPNQDCSVLNDLAMEEPSLKKAANIDPNYRQLVLQCVVAELNLQGTIIDGGNCGGTIPGTNYMFDLCCGLDSVCSTGAPIGGVTVSDCQAAVASFNADRPCLDPTACVLNPGGAAQSSEVKTVNTLNDPGSGADCGGRRTWVTTSTGKNGKK